MCFAQCAQMKAFPEGDSLEHCNDLVNPLFLLEVAPDLRHESMRELITNFSNQVKR
jgi:hypothetical protein